MPCSAWQLNELAVGIGGGKVVNIISVVIDVVVDVGDVEDSKL